MNNDNRNGGSYGDSRSLGLYDNNRSGGSYNDTKSGGFYGSSNNFGTKSDVKFINTEPGSKLRVPDYKNLNVAKTMKNFYGEHAAVSRRNQSEIDQFITGNEITLQGQNIPRPVFEFNESTFPGILVFLL